LFVRRASIRHFRLRARRCSKPGQRLYHPVNSEAIATVMLRYREKCLASMSFLTRRRSPLQWWAVRSAQFRIPCGAQPDGFGKHQGDVSRPRFRILQPVLQFRKLATFCGEQNRAQFREFVIGWTLMNG
jgi:hypothetical protein